MAAKAFLKSDEPFWAALGKRLHEPVDNASLVFFRIAFGGFLLYEIWSHFVNGWITAFYVDTSFRFTYFGFDWIQPWPGVGIYIHFFAVGALAILIMAGLWYRLSATLAFVGFSYIFLLDRTQYLNHLYLVGLISFLMIVIPANRSFSIDAWRNPSIRSETAPSWALWLIRAQVAVVYFYGGLAKINGDWLLGEPVRLWMSWSTDFPLIGPLLTQNWAVFSISYGGLFIDLFIVAFLLWPKTRIPAFIVATLFHLINARLFNIGIFPWFMIVSTAMFFAPGWPRLLINLVREKRPDRLASQKGGGVSVPRLGWLELAVIALLGGFFLVQAVVPLRHYLYPGDASWTEEGHRFSWRMMLRYKDSEAMFTATDKANGRTWEIDPLEYITPRQLGIMSTRPDMILQFSHHVAEKLRQQGIEDVEVRANIQTSLNNRDQQLLIDPEVDLIAHRASLMPAPWIMPLTEPLNINRVTQVAATTTESAEPRELQEAIIEYNEAIKLRPGDPAVYNNRGNAYIRLGHVERAIQDYDKAIRLNPEHTLSYANRAIAYTVLGNDDDARKDIERAVALGFDRSVLETEIARQKEFRKNE